MKPFAHPQDESFVPAAIQRDYVPIVKGTASKGKNLKKKMTQRGENSEDLTERHPPASNIFVGGKSCVGEKKRGKGKGGQLASRVSETRNRRGKGSRRPDGGCG